MTASSYTVQSGTISANLGGTASLSKTSTGTVTISNRTGLPNNISLTGGGLSINTVAQTGGNLAYTGNLSGSGTLNKAGVGTLTLNKSGAGFWKPSGTNTHTGSTNLNGGTLGLGSADAIGSSGTISFGGGRLRHSSSNTTNYGSRFSTAAGQAYSVDTNDQSVTWASNPSCTGGTLTKVGTGTLILTGTNSHTNTAISGGTLQVGNGSTSGTLGSGAVTNNATLAFNRSDALTVANDISGTGGLTKSGSSSLTLTGTNTYTGATTLNAGTLVVNGTLANTPLTIANGGTFNFELGTNSDLLAITGALSAGGTLSFNFSDSGGLTGYTSYTLFTFSSQGGLDYSDLNALTLPGQALNTSFGTGGWMINGNSLQVQFVPEPSSLLLGLLGAAGLMGRRRRPAFCPPKRVSFRRSTAGLLRASLREFQTHASPETPFRANAHRLHPADLVAPRRSSRAGLGIGLE